MKNLIRFNKDKKFLVFDYETCNLNLVSKDNKPWQLAFLICSSSNILEKHNYLLKWDDLKISDEARKITGFSDSVYQKQSVCPSEVLDKFNSYLYNENYYIVGHNILNFDIYIHNIHQNLCGKPTDYSYLDRCIDTNCLAKAMSLEIEYNQSNLLFWQMKLTNLHRKGIKTNLMSLCEKYKIPFDPKKLHDALYDIEKNFEVFKKLIWSHEI